MKKKFLSVLTAAICALEGLSLTGLIASAETGTYGVFTYETVDENRDGIADSITITGCDKSVISVDIPTEIAGLPVKRIGEWAFSNCVIDKITIPETIISLGEYAFYGCESINKLEIPDSITVLEPYVFALSGVGDVTFPSTLEKISEYAFYGCENIVGITIPESVEVIETSAFAFCTKLKMVIIHSYNCAIDTGEYGDSVFSNSYVASDGVNAGYYTYNGTIYGYDGSTAQSYAALYSRDFLSLGISATQVTNNPDKALKGDINCDGVVDIADVVLLTEYLVNKGSITEKQVDLADLNDDELINVFDVVLVKRIILL